MADNSRAINRVFTRKVISDLVQDGKSDVFDYVVKRYDSRIDIIHNIGMIC